jgi:hypothetical protein
MTMTTLFQDRIQAAQSALDLAVAEGAQTDELRAELKAATDAREAAIEAEAKAMTQAVEKDLATSLKRLSAPPATPGADLPADALEVARALVLAREASAVSQAKATEHGKRLEALRARLAALETERKQIVVRRAQGQCQDDDGPVLALLVADAEGLRDLIDQAGKDAPGPDGSGARDFEQAWTRATGRARHERLGQLASVLDHALTDVLKEVRLASASIGDAAHVKWNPSADLVSALRG